MIIVELNLRKEKWLVVSVPMDIQMIIFELKLRKEKWLVVSVPVDIQIIMCELNFAKRKMARVVSSNGYTHDNV